MKIKNHNDTIISSITPSVGGSVALVRISGKKAVEISNDFFPPKNLLKISGGRFYFGKLIDEHNATIDEVVLLIYREPNSYTGEDIVEISCHSNPFIIEKVIKLFLNSGCRLAEPGEFSKRAFLNGKMDLIQAEAVADLIAAKSEAVVKNSLLQIDGRLSQIIKNIKEDLIKTASLLELDLDFNEDDIEIIKADQIIDSVNSAYTKIDSLLKSYNYGRILSKGIEVLITGKPNVGKSSLMNALLDKDRVIVSEQPGTTRDIVHEDILVDNILIRFIDSAGIQITSDSIEAEGVERARKLFDNANIILLMLDISEPFSQDDRNLLKAISSFYSSKMILVKNKIDIKEDGSNLQYLEKKNFKAFPVSAINGDNVRELKDKILKKIFSIDKNISEEILITNERQNTALIKTKEALVNVKKGIENHFGYEFAAVDMRLAIDSLSEITGEISTDDILDNIFSNFCIGK